MAKTLAEIKRHNKRIGQYFFDRGNPPVLSKKGNYLISAGMGGEGYVVYRYNEHTGKINLVENALGAYSWEPHKTLSAAKSYVEDLPKK